MCNTRSTGSFSRSGQYLAVRFFCQSWPKYGREPEHVAPPRAVVRRMRIARLVAMSMMLAMVGDPGESGAFAGKSADQRKQPFHRPIGLKAAVRQHPMEAEADAQSADPAQHDRQAEGFPSEEKRAPNAMTCTVIIHITTVQSRPSFQGFSRTASSMVSSAVLFPAVERTAVEFTAGGMSNSNAAASASRMAVTRGCNEMGFATTTAAAPVSFGNSPGVLSEGPKLVDMEFAP